MTAGSRSDPVVAVRLESHPRAPAEARALVDALPIALSPAQRDDMRLALSELVTNSVVHGNQRPEDVVDIRISVSEATIRCEVRDQGAGFRPGAPRRSSVGGLGLILVERIAARWGTHENGRRVWFELQVAG